MFAPLQFYKLNASDTAEHLTVFLKFLWNKYKKIVQYKFCSLFSSLKQIKKKSFRWIMGIHHKSSIYKYNSYLFYIYFYHPISAGKFYHVIVQYLSLQYPKFLGGFLCRTVCYKQLLCIFCVSFMNYKQKDLHDIKGAVRFQNCYF